MLVRLLPGTISWNGNVMKHIPSFLKKENNLETINCCNPIMIVYLKKNISHYDGRDGSSYGQAVRDAGRTIKGLLRVLLRGGNLLKAEYTSCTNAPHFGGVG